MAKITDKIRKKLIQLGVVAATMAPLSNANASNEITTNDRKTNKIEITSMDEFHNYIYSNEGDSIISEINDVGYQLRDNNKFLEVNHEEYNRTDSLDNGYYMKGHNYMHRKNGRIKKNDTDLELHAPDGRVINCNFLNKIDFTNAGTIYDVVTGDSTVITDELAKSMNDASEKKAKIEIIKKIKNPEDRKALEQYVHRIRMETQELIGSKHTVTIRSETLQKTYEVTNPSKQKKKSLKNYMRLPQKTR